MPKLELGDLQSVTRLKELIFPPLFDAVQKGLKIVAPIPSCVLMYKQELPLMFPDDEQVSRVAEAFFDPFEFLRLLHKNKIFITEFVDCLGSVSCRTIYEGKEYRALFRP